MIDRKISLHLIYTTIKHSYAPPFWYPKNIDQLLTANPGKSGEGTEPVDPTFPGFLYG